MWTLFKYELYKLIYRKSIIIFLSFPILFLLLRGFMPVYVDERINILSDFFNSDIINARIFFWGRILSLTLFLCSIFITYDVFRIDKRLVIIVPYPKCKLLICKLLVLFFLTSFVIVESVILSLLILKFTPTIYVTAIYIWFSSVMFFVFHYTIIQLMRNIYYYLIFIFFLISLRLFLPSSLHLFIPYNYIYGGGDMSWDVAISKSQFMIVIELVCIIVTIFKFKYFGKHDSSLLCI